MARLLSFVLGVLAVAGAATADEVWLRGGGRITGIVLEAGDEAVVIEVGPGRLSVPASRVQAISRASSALATYRHRAQALAHDDVEGWRALGLWAHDAGLSTQATEAFERVVALAPDDPVAHQALGHVRLRGEWVDEDEAYRARGYVRFEGRWVTPAEQAAELAERTARRRAVEDRRESEARVREAEARAAAAAARTASPEPGGIPLGYGWGGWTGAAVVLPPSRPSAVHPPRPAPRPPRPAPARPAPRTLPSSSAGLKRH